MTVMSKTAADWVRQHAWTPAMRNTYADTPGFYRRCACQGGPSGHCEHGRHDDCRRAAPLLAYETMICGKTGEYPAGFPEPMIHATHGISATGHAERQRHALVWLADRVCRWVCPCPCHTLSLPGQQLPLFGC